MKSRVKTVRARNAGELAKLLGLDPEDAVEMDFRARLNQQIVEVVKRKGLTHQEVAKRSGASRTRITAILNANTSGISTDLMLRILYSLGYRAKVTFAPVTLAA